MSVRFNRTGTGVVRDHNELTNKGTRTHAEIDSYMAELDAVRGLFPSIGARLDAIEQKNADQDTKDAEQDTRLTTAEGTLGDHETRLGTAEAAITTIQSDLDAAEADIVQLETDMTGVKGDVTSLSSRVTTIEGSISSRDADIQDLQTEVTDARGTYPTLKERIDAATDAALSGRVDDLEAEVQEARGSYATLKERIEAGGGGGGTGLQTGYQYQVFQVDNAGIQFVELTEPYEVGSGELEVFVNGVRNTLGIDYTESTPTRVTFTEPLQEPARVICRIRDRIGVIPTELHEEHFSITDDTTTALTLTESSDGPDRKLEVYLDGILLDQAFYVKADRTITFPEPVDKGSLVSCVITDRATSSETHRHEQVFITNEADKTYTLTNFTYGVGFNQLELYLGGQRLVKDVHYRETTSNSFTLEMYPPSGIALVASKEGYRSNPDIQSLSRRMDELEQTAISQTTVLNVVATDTTPYRVDLAAVNTDYRMPPITVLQLVADGRWRGAVHGRDYDFEITSTVLSVSFYVDGSYKINY